MNNQHPITPPPELVQQWSVSSPIQPSDESWAYELFIAHQAARWGADQELDACCKWFANEGYGTAPDRIRMHRRPEPPSLKEQALKALKVSLTPDGQVTLDITDLNTIRRALEALPDE
jgi:hypothetical protein